MKWLNYTTTISKDLGHQAQGALFAALTFLVICFGQSGDTGNTSAICLIICLYAALTIGFAINQCPQVKLPKLLSLSLLCFGLLMFKSVLSLLPVYPPSLSNDWQISPAHDSLTIDVTLTVFTLERMAALCGFLITGWIVGAFPIARRTYLTCLITFAGIYAIIAIIGHTLHPTLDMFGHLKDIHNGRLVASLANANAASVLLGVFNCIALSKLLERLHALPLVHADLASSIDMVSRRCAWPAGCFIATSAAIALTASRGGIMATLAGNVVVLITMALSHTERFNADKRGRIVWALAALLFLLVVSVISSHRLGDRAVEITDEPNRLTLVVFYLQCALKAPIMGFGLGTFPLINLHIINADNFKSIGALNSPHNLIALWLFEDGWFGLILRLISLISAGAFLLLRIATMRRRQSKVYLAATLGASILLAQHNLYDFSAEYLSISGLWASLLGVACAQIVGDRGRSSRAALVAEPTVTTTNNSVY